MGSLLRLDFFVDATELTLNARDLMPRGFTLLVIHIHGGGSGQPSCARQPPFPARLRRWIQPNAFQRARNVVREQCVHER